MEKLLRDFVKRGVLYVVLPNGKKKTFQGEVNGIEATIRLHTKGAVAKLLTSPEMAVGEGYMDGTISFPTHGVKKFLELVHANRHLYYEKDKKRFLSRQIGVVLRNLRGINLRAASRRNVEQHYSLSNALFDLFLDKDMQYSCAYFSPEALARGEVMAGGTASGSIRDGTVTSLVASDRAASDVLDDAQQAKKDHIIRKLVIDDQCESLLDIGCGWGGMLMNIAEQYPHVKKLHGITLSTQQIERGQERIAQAGLDDRVSIFLTDYRDVTDTYDRIVSIGMFEHIGKKQMATYFRTLKRLLKPNGIAVVHSIVSPRDGGGSHPWISKYIFPGGYIPSISEVVPHIEAEQLFLCDVEVWRLHYAETLRAWRYRFIEEKDSVISMFDERFFRMWHFYLAA
ncbi:MAG: cyclopropane-fatty-acyl-phospholipid synthase family protein, partial [Alphaproteobacteria bacterium]|nr:cyclopropane-fatty-acyl-phospholipid synthase family protein [Alphaproteobacteria bacterium]